MLKTYLIPNALNNVNEWELVNYKDRFLSMSSKRPMIKPFAVCLKNQN